MTITMAMTEKLASNMAQPMNIDVAREVIILVLRDNPALRREIMSDTHLTTPFWRGRVFPEQ